MTKITCDTGRLTVANGRAWECRGGEWVAIVGQADQSLTAHAGPPVWVDVAMIGGLVAAGVAAVAMMRLVRMDWIEWKRKLTNEQTNEH